MPAPSVIELSSLDGTTGFRISGEGANNWSGNSVASAGDVNGDGFDDLMIGAWLAGPNGPQSGASYVVFGQASGFGANLNLSTLDGTNGFQINGETGYDRAGVSVASAGDVNGDGFDDLIVGAYHATPTGPISGASYVVFGKSSGFAADLELSTLDGTTGFRINGAASHDLSGRSVASAGDVNGDGIDDLIVGAYQADPNGNTSGASYVVFGQTSGFAASLNLSALDGANGFRIAGEAAYDRSGRSVASAGDVNGDGFDDLIIGAFAASPNGTYSGASYLVFGRASGFAASLNLSTLDGTNGFQISGEAAIDHSGISVASAGDVNGDGFDDLIIGADRADPNGYESGMSYVVFGQASGFAANLDLSTLNGTNGFQISGEANLDYSGRSVASAGDVNGDGFDDLIVGAQGADPNGSRSGASYVVFGRASGVGANLDLSALDGTNGFKVNGEAASDGAGRSVASAGDVNGDGFDDLVIGADGADPNGSASGASYVLFGGAFGATTVVTGTSAADMVIGTTGADTLTGGGGADVFRGGAGNDRLVLPTAGDYADIDGGTGFDTLAFSGAGTTLNLTTTRPAEIISIEAVELTGSFNNTLIVDRLAVLDLTEERTGGNAIIRVTGDAGDAVQLNGLGWSGGGTVTEGAITYTRYVNDKAQMWVQNGVSVSAVVELSTLDGTSGFQINGEAANDFSAASVASAGDINGDGFEDLIIGAFGADPSGVLSGASYVVFGRASGFGANLNLSTLDGTNGFQINGVAASDFAGGSVAAAGDVNGDGFDDLIIGATGVDANGASSGAAYVVFGRASGFGANLGLSTLDGTNGFRISGELSYDRFGRSVASAGDMNGDGFADLIIGAPEASPNAYLSGASYVVFGRASGFGLNLDLSTLDGSGGFQISGVAAYDYSAMSVASAGDINGDGFDDAIIGAQSADPNGPGSGASYVLFGRASGFAANLNLSSLDGTNGFRISGEWAWDRSGVSVASAGDVNGDGFDDLIIGAYGADPNTDGSGATYVVFGKASGFAANLNLSTLDGTNGFQINGEVTGDISGRSVASAGDVNGDGYDDLIIGAYGADPNGGISGASYVVFGRASGFGANLNLSALDGTNGFQINGEAEDDRSGRIVASAGDVNGDGFDDLVIGADGADPNGSESGASYVLFGGAFGATTVVTTTGTGAAEVLVGGIGADTLTGGGGADVFRSGAGNDRLVLPTASDYADINGGTGFDTLAFSGAGATLNLVTTRPAEITSIEAVELTGSGNNTLIVDRLAVLDLTDERVGGSAIIRVTGDTGDGVQLNGLGWARGSAVTEGAITYTRYANDKAEMWVQNGIAVTAVVELSSLDGTNGFQISGEAAYDRFGRSVASAGDINGDGFDDLIIGASGADPNGENSGASYVVFGQASGFATDIDLSTLDGTSGFRINGVAASDFSGASVASAGDVNGDGFDDLIIGASTADPNGDDTGASYVVFGKASGFASTLDLSTLNGSNGFQINGEGPYDYAGRSVASAGDLNGDGFADLIIGAWGDDPNGNYTGASYVVFGRASGFGATVNLSTLNGTTGFKLNGEAVYDYSGRSVASAGDVNGDGFADLIIGAWGADANGVNSGASYVVFGQASGFAANFNLSTLNGTNGFKISGESADDQSATSVASAGDVNGDGFEDLIVGAFGASPNGNASGASYVVFGQAAGFSANLDLTTLNGTNGFRINGESAGDFLGDVVASAGDVNGDGFDDLIIGADYADPNGDRSGASYLVFGRASGFGATFDLSTLDGTNGFQINGETAYDLSGSAVASAGDVNGDGFDDLIVGGDYADPNGSLSGASYVLFGGAFGATTVVTGTAAADMVIGTTGADTLTGGGGADVFRGGAGNDRLVLPTAGDYADIDGGTGFDTLAFSGAGTVLDLTRVRPAELTSIEAVELTGSGRNTLVLDRLAVLDLTEERVAGAAILRITGDAGDAVELAGGGWSVSGTVTEGAVTFTRYVNDKAEAWVQNGVTARPVIELATLGLPDGFRIDGAAAGDTAFRGLAPAGDFNGDGFEDFIVGSWYFDAGGLTDTGAAYVLFGKATGFGTLDLGALSPADGMVITGAAALDLAGRTVYGIGDVNGDGRDDILVGARDVDHPGAANAGSSYVIYGRASPPATIDLAALTAADGVAIAGIAADDQSGSAVSGVGDFNGDGLTDFLIGAPGADPSSRSGAGAAYVVFGGAGGLADTDLATLTAAEGLRFDGATDGEAAGFAVGSAGDINGDGLDDIIIGARTATVDGVVAAGVAYVLYGTASGVATNDLAALTAAQGFRIEGTQTNGLVGQVVASAGDINGDGLDDLIIGAWNEDSNGLTDNGAAYVIFGKTTGFGTIDLGALQASDGFRISGAAAGDRLGGAVGSAGDLNGDGFDDLVVGAVRADAGAGIDAGRGYVIFGRASGFSTIDVGLMTAADGLVINGAAASDLAGRGITSAGDINGDGFDDLTIGAYYADPANRQNAGSGYVIFGHAQGTATVTTGTAAADRVIGTTGADTLTGGGGADVFRGGAGDDRLVLPTAVGFADIDGGTGLDTLALSGAGTTLNLATTRPAEITSIEAIDLTGSGHNALVVDRLAVLDLTEERVGGVAILRVTGNAGDRVGFADTGWAMAGTVTEGATTFLRYVNGGAELRIASTLWVDASDAADTLTGGPSHDRIRGGGGADSIAGGMGNDLLRGGTGNDTLTGDNGPDALFGDAGDDSLSGGADAGNDSLDGGTGNDTMAGGAGDDRYQVDSGDDVVDETGGSGIDSVVTTVSFTLGDGVENAFAQGIADLTLTGNALDNRLFGGSGNDSLAGDAGADDLRGGAGTDTMAGGAGHDRYTVDAAGDVIDETNGLGGDAGGIDLVFASVDITLGSFVDNVTLTGTALQATGNAIANTLTGNDHGNTLAGLGDADRLMGHAGDDSLDGGTAGDALYGAAGADTLVGGNGNDVLDGGTEDDRLEGGLGRDVIRTGTGADIVVFGAAPVAMMWDTVTDFDVATDTLEISAAAFGGGLVAGTPVQFVSGAAPTAAGVNGGVFLYNTATGSLVFDANGDVAGGAIEIARFATLAALGASDFTVVA